MIGSMFVGLLVGFLAGALTDRGERMGLNFREVSRCYKIYYNKTKGLARNLLKDN